MAALIPGSGNAVCPRAKFRRPHWIWLLAPVVGLAAVGRGATQQENWVGGAGLWTDAGNWNPATVPNDNISIYQYYTVQINSTGNTPADVTLPGGGPLYAVINMSLGSASSLTLQSGAGLQVGTSATPTLLNAGTINLAGGSSLFLPASGIVSGGGTINLASGAYLKPANPNSFQIGNQTVVASSLDVTGWTNNGTIRNAPGQDLAISIIGNGGFTNNALIDQEAGGTLTVTGNMNIYNGATGGTIAVGPGSAAVINGQIGGNLRVVGNGIITGNISFLGRGTIENSSTGIINLSPKSEFFDYSGSIINPAGGQISIPAGRLNLQQGDSIINGGNLVLGALGISQNVTQNVYLRGGGRITIQGPESGIGSGSATAMFDNVDQTIDGATTINAPFVNGGTIISDINQGTMTIYQYPPVNSAHVFSVNNGTMGASNGGQMIVNGSVTGSGNWVANGGALNFKQPANISTIGPISATNDGRIEVGSPAVSGTVYSPVILTGSNLSLDASSSISNEGTIRLFGNLSYAMKDPSQWSWSPAAGPVPAVRLIMDGGITGQPTSAAGWATLELAEKDNGTNGRGFDTSFAIPTLEIGPDSHILLTDLLDNGNRGGPAGAPEALYVDQLSFDDPTGQVNLNGLHLYYRTLVGGSASQIIDSPMSVPEPAALGIVGLMGLATLLRRPRPGGAG
ncbi:MAG TPA: hypothetical protein VFC78_12125 [Tepidisphaeraceae bacterium]|nr:hypothetical protein [Tepidisphaeraceae bacterium]